MIKKNFLPLLTAILIFSTTQTAQMPKTLYFRYTPTALTYLVMDTAAAGALGIGCYGLYNTFASLYYCCKPQEVAEDAAYNNEKVNQYYRRSIEALAAMGACASAVHIAFLKPLERITELVL